MGAIRFILGDQLSHNISSLHGADKDNDIILMCEVMEESEYVKHHKQKIAYIFSAMRHFSQELSNKGYQVEYVKLDDNQNTQSFDEEVKRAVKKHKASKIIITEPGEYRVLQKIKQWPKTCDCEVDIIEDNRFLSSINDFKDWAKGKKSLRMEFFYREMRKKHRILITKNNQPVGGEWNYDKENREKIQESVEMPATSGFKPDSITREVIDLVNRQFKDHIGNLENFNWAVTRREALICLNEFISKRLKLFGRYQDAMLSNQPFLFHSIISPYLNSGLLSPLEVCQKAEEAYDKGHAPLNSVEGFIRQILGWREYIRGIYWLKMPKYKEQNYFNARKKLPDFYWDGKTDMHCLSQAIGQTIDHAYAHHIQRLMITGNFALLAGISPKQVCEWYLLVYLDAYEWVELPNTLGMALYGDGGQMSSKPYAASGKYINKMSNYCQSCKYHPAKLLEDDACPFNALYWDFIARNTKVISNNQRLKFVYATWNKMESNKKKEIRQKAKKLLSNL